MQKSNEIFISLLKTELPTSDAVLRQIWAKKIVNKEIPLLILSQLLVEKRVIALRFSWLLSDIGMNNPAILLNALPKLFEKRQQVESFDFEQSFATYWSLVGVPTENESEAIDLILKWLQSATINVTIKSRALIPLEQLALNYPELRHEIRVCLEEQLHNSTVQFQKRLSRLLKRLQ
ncbi:MAG: hypothetical protein ACI8ZM_004132 [Crocinitomix sp.]|jgi:hypothetical protein